MAGEIFISYRRSDEVHARLLHSRLKEQGVDAWYDAHVGAGEDWRETTARALQAAPIFVLLFSKAAAASEDIAKELAAATFSKKLVVPVRLEDIQPEGAFLYELASRNWINAFENTEAKLGELAKSLADLVKSGKTDPSMLPFDRGAGAAAPKPVNRLGLIAAGAGLAVVLLAGLGAFFLQAKPPPPPLNQRIAFFGFEAKGDDQRQSTLASRASTELFDALDRAGLNLAAASATLGKKPEDMFAKADELGARYVLSGEIHAEGETLVASIRLEDAPARAALWPMEFRGTGELAETLPLRVSGLVARIVDCTVQLRASLKRDEMDVVRELPYACVDMNLPGVDKPDRWIRLLPKINDSALMLAAAAAALADNRPMNPDGTIQGNLTLADQAGQRALQLDPSLSEVHMSLHHLSAWKREPLARQEAHLDEAKRLAPNDPETLRQYGVFLRNTGRTGESINYLANAARLRPALVIFGVQYARALAANGNKSSAEQEFAAALRGSPGGQAWALWFVDAVFAGVSDPADLLAKAPALLRDDFIRQPEVDCWKRIIDARSRATSQAIKEAGDIALACVETARWRHSLAFTVIGSLGDADRAFAMDPELWAWSIPGVEFLFGPAMHGVRAHQKFPDLAEKLGLMDYWKADPRHAPDFCDTESEIAVCQTLKAAYAAPETPAKSRNLRKTGNFGMVPPPCGRANRDSGANREEVVQIQRLKRTKP